MTNFVGIDTVENQIRTEWLTIDVPQDSSDRGAPIENLFASLAWSNAGGIKYHLSTICQLSRAQIPETSEKAKEANLAKIIDAEMALERAVDMLRWSYCQANPLFRPLASDILTTFGPSVERFANNRAVLIKGAGYTEKQADALIEKKLGLEQAAFEPVKDELYEILHRVIKMAQADFREALEKDIPYVPCKENFDITTKEAAAMLQKASKKAIQYGRNGIEANVSRSENDLTTAMGANLVYKSISKHHDKQALIWLQEDESAPDMLDMTEERETYAEAARKHRAAYCTGNENLTL